jgi:hypothetical protein
MAHGNTGLSIDVNFEAFEGQINNRGLQVTHEYSLPCPCIIQDVDEGAVGHANPACTHCLGLGYLFRNPVYMMGLVGNLTFSRNHVQSGWIKPGDLSLGPSIRARKISDFDRITLPVGVPVEPQVIVRGKESNFTPRPVELAQNEDLLYWESSDGEALILEDLNGKQYHPVDYRLEGRKIIWAPGAGPPIGTSYAIKYCAYPEYTAWTTPISRWDRERSMGQRVMLRKIALETDLKMRQIVPPWRERVERNLKQWDYPFLQNERGEISTDPQR